MAIRDTLLRTLGGVPGAEAAQLREAIEQHEGDAAQLREVAQQLEGNTELFQERLAELELALEDQGWSRLAADGDSDFSRGALRKINQMARVYWLKNPLIKRSVYVQTQYVFGQGVSIQGHHPLVNEVVQGFLNDLKNQAELTSHEARMMKEAELQVESNVFFTFFTHPVTGHVRLRSIPFDEVDDIIYNPDDSKDPWYYKRVRTKRWVDLGTGEARTKQETIFYPALRHNPKGGHPRTIGGAPVEWNTPVYHVAVNKLSSMKFSVSELYAAMDWAKAYKDFLEDWATIVKSYARFAWQYNTKGGARGVAAVKAKLGSALSGSNGAETNPSPAAGSIAINTEAGKLEPIRTAGATTDAEDGRRMLLMVCAGTGIYEHYLGDPSTGNLATASSMERPMELMFKDRQTLWQGVMLTILGFVIDQAAKAPGGPLAAGAIVSRNEYGEEVVTLGLDPERGELLDRHVDVDFPDILAHDVKARVEAIISAGTLDGKTPAGIDLKTLTRMLLVALGEDDVDAMIEVLFPEGWEEERADAEAAAAAKAQAAFAGQQDEGMAEAVRTLREAVRKLAHAS